MVYSSSSHKDAAYLPKILKHANEKKYTLRKVIYDIARLSYEKGTRTGDYQIRKIVQEINDELELCDNHVKSLEIKESASLAAYKELLLFFENKYLDNHILNEKIELLKQELINQQNDDLQHNIENKDKNYKRNAINPFREELKRDLNRFESSIIKNLAQNLSEYLTAINELLFYYNTNEILRKWSIKNYYNETDKSLNEAINDYLVILSKIQNKVFTEKEAQTTANSCLSQTGLKERLIHLKNLNENNLNNIILEAIAYYSAHHREKITAQREQIRRQETSGQQTISYDKVIVNKNAGILENTLSNLKYLVEFKNNTNIDIISVDRAGKHLYYCPDSGKILLKDIADYLKDSLIFIIDWLYIDLKKNPDMISTYILFVECLPDIVKFYDLLNTANATAARTINQKKNLWGETEQFISAGMANKLVDVIRSLRLELKDAFIKSIIEIEMNKSAGFAVILKKINIIYDSYDNAQKKITSEINRLKL